MMQTFNPEGTDVEGVGAFAIHGFVAIGVTVVFA